MPQAAALELVERRNLAFCHYPLSRDEEETIDALLGTEPNCDVVVTPNHHVDADGVLHGFRVAYPPHTAEVVLPVSREMFFGHTIVEAGGSSAAVHADVMRLAGDPERSAALMRELLAEIDAAAKGHEPGLHCVPRNVQALDAARPGGTLNAEGRATDSAPWQPELPVRLGVYHAFVRGFSKDVREHKLFLGVTGGCTLAAESYYNLLLDLGRDTDVEEVADAEETFWLRQASYRARCRLLALAADKFGLAVKTIADINAYDQRRMALATTDSVYNNIARLRSGHVAVFNECIDTTTSKNGIVNAMHPAEGLWVYRGVSRSSAGAAHFGFGFGDQRRCGVFPSGSFAVHRAARAAAPSEPTTVFARAAAECVVAYGHRHVGQQYSWPDESYLRVLGEMGWDRNNGIVELVPIVVGVTRAA